MVTPKLMLLACCLAVVAVGLIYVLPAVRGHTVVKCEDHEVSIQGLDRVRLLRALWDRQEVHGLGGLGGGFVPWDEDTTDYAREVVTKYIDYFQGRAIKMNLAEDCIDPSLYDRYTFLPARGAVDRLRARMLREEERMKRA